MIKCTRLSVKDPYWPHTCASEEKFDMEEANGSAGCSNDAAAELAAAETYFLKFTKQFHFKLKYEIVIFDLVLRYF